MSDHHDVGTISNLEELFLSREFGHSEEIDSPTWIDELWLGAAYNPEAHLDPGPLEEVFLSRDFGRPMAEDDEETTADLDGPGATVLAFTPRDASARQRAVGVPQRRGRRGAGGGRRGRGSGHSNPPGVPQAQAQAQAPAAAGPGSGSASAAPGAPSVSPGGTPTVAANDQGSLPAVLTSLTSPAPQVSVAAPPGSTVTVVPTTPATGTGGAPSPTPPRLRRHHPRRAQVPSAPPSWSPATPWRRRERRSPRRPARWVPPSRRRRPSPASSGASGPPFRASARCSVDLGLKGSGPRREIGAYFLLLYRDF